MLLLWTERLPEGKARLYEFDGYRAPDLAGSYGCGWLRRFISTGCRTSGHTTQRQILLINSYERFGSASRPPLAPEEAAWSAGSRRYIRVAASTVVGAIVGTE